MTTISPQIAVDSQLFLWKVNGVLDCDNEDTYDDDDDEDCDAHDNHYHHLRHKHCHLVNIKFI